MRYSNMKSCCHIPTHIFSMADDNVNYLACDRLGIRHFDGDLIINLTNEPGIRAGSNTYNIPQLSKHMKNLPQEIVLSWPDYGVPPVKSSFWKALHEYVKQKKYTTVCFHCEFGHGRTGTALSAMMISLMEVDVETAINTMRGTYCKEAVESDTQIEYLINLDLELNQESKILPERMFQELLSDLKPITNLQSNDEEFVRYVKTNFYSK